MLTSLSPTSWLVAQPALQPMFPDRLPPVLMIKTKYLVC